MLKVSEDELVCRWSQVRHKTFGWVGVVEQETPLYILVTFSDGGQQWCLRDAFEVTLAPTPADLDI